MAEAMTSPVFYLAAEDGLRWHCANHMCRSPWFQLSIEGHIVCNGCMVRPPEAVLTKAKPQPSPLQPNVLVDPDRDKARTLEDVQRGPYPEIYTAQTMPDNTRTWLSE